MRVTARDVLCLGAAVVCWVACAGSARAEGLSSWRAALPAACDAVAVCVGIDLHVVVGEGGEPVQTSGWARDHLKEANRHFAPLGVGFAVTSIAALPEAQRVISTRAERDRLGRRRWARGRIAVFVVGQLDNVDEPGVIRGVHWRDRAKRSRRWVILSSVAPDMVLAHELGHYFGLPHSEYAVSIMNKTRRRAPPLSERTFAPEEIARMRRRLRVMRRGGAIAPLK